MKKIVIFISVMVCLSLAAGVKIYVDEVNGKNNPQEEIKPLERVRKRPSLPLSQPETMQPDKPLPPADSVKRF